MSLVHPCLRSPKISLDAPVNLKEFGQIPLDLVCLDSKKIAKCWPKNSFRFYFFSHVFRCIKTVIACLNLQCQLHARDYNFAKSQNYPKN